MAQSQAALDKFRLLNNLPPETTTRLGPDKALFARAWNSMRDQLLGISALRTGYEWAALRLIQSLNYNLSMSQQTYNAGEHSFLVELNTYLNAIEAMTGNNPGVRSKVQGYAAKIFSHFYEYNRSPVNEHYYGIINAIRAMESDLRLMPQPKSVSENMIDHFDKWLSRFTKIASDTRIAEAEAAKLKTK